MDIDHAHPSGLHPCFARHVIVPKGLPSPFSPSKSDQHKIEGGLHRDVGSVERPENLQTGCPKGSPNHHPFHLQYKVFLSLDEGCPKGVPDNVGGTRGDTA